MRILRSWPATVPAGRAHVVDNIERLVMDGYDYRVLGDVNDDVLLLEWDIAVGLEDLERFAAAATEDPGRVLVAPYRLYSYASGRPHLGRWAHRRYEGDPATGHLRHVDENDTACHLFGLGMTYLPRDITQAFLAAWDGRVCDVSLSGWHYRNITPEVPIAWDVRPVHLHYDIP
jgi:hypothetical protein